MWTQFASLNRSKRCTQCLKPSKSLYGNPQNVGLSSIFSVSKMLENVMKITFFELLHGPFVYRNQASGRVLKNRHIWEKYTSKLTTKPSKKIRIPVSQLQKRHASDRLLNSEMHQNALAFAVPSVACTKCTKPIQNEMIGNFSSR